MHRVSEHTVSVFPRADVSKQKSTCSSCIAASEEPPGMAILLKHKPWYEKYWEPLYENSRRRQKRVKTHLALLCLLAWKTQQWNCVLQWYTHWDLRSRGSLLGQLRSWASLPPPFPYQPDRFPWAVLTSRCYVLSPLNGRLNSGISTEINGYMVKLPASTLFVTSRFSRPSCLFDPCVTQKWFNTCEGLTQAHRKLGIPRGFLHCPQRVIVTKSH